MMSLADRIDLTPQLSDLKFGLKPNRLFGMRRFGREAISAGISQDGFFDAGDFKEVVVGPDAQRLSTCQFNAYLKAYERAIWREDKIAVQLDAEVVYRTYHADRGEPEYTDNGSHMGDAFRTCQLHAWQPDDAEMFDVEMTAKAIAEAIRDHDGMDIGVSAHDGYRPKRLAPNGSIDVLGDRNLLWGFNGHAMHVCVAAYGNGVGVLGACQSWGRIGFEKRGIIWIPVVHACKWALDKGRAYRFGSLKGCRRWEAIALEAK